MIQFYIIDDEESSLEDYTNQGPHKYVWAGKDFFSQTEVIRSSVTFEDPNECQTALEMFIERMKKDEEVVVLGKR